MTVEASSAGVVDGVDDNNPDGAQQNSAHTGPPFAQAPEVQGFAVDVPVPTTSEYETTTSLPAPSIDAAETTLATASIGGFPTGLPPKPPAQEQPNIHPGYKAETDIRAFHPHSQHAPVHANTQQTSTFPAAAQLPAFAPAPGQSAVSSVNGLPPPPLASFQQQQKPMKSSVEHASQSPASKANRMRELESQRQIKEAAGEVLDDADVPWTPETQRKYDVFLNEERKYVTEGNWEQFPHGSRLFVGMIGLTIFTPCLISQHFTCFGQL